MTQASFLTGFQIAAIVSDKVLITFGASASESGMAEIPSPPSAVPVM